MANDFIRTMLLEKQGLFYLVHEFNHSPGGYINYEYVDDWITEEMLQKIRTNSLAIKQFSKLVSDRFALTDQYFYDFAEPRLRLALVSPAVLNKLFLYAGAAYCSENIAKVIDRESVINLREIMGNELYLFALKRAPLLVPEKPNIKIPSEDTHTLYQNVMTASQLCFEMVFAGAPHNLIRRLTLKFSKAIDWNFNISLTSNDRDKVWTFLHRILIKEIASEWSPCFI